MNDRMNAAIQKLRDIQDKNLIGGGQQHIDRQHKRGKMTARERIDCLIDPGTFKELGSCVQTTGYRIDGRKSDAPCDGAIIGTAKVDGRLTAVYASDFTVLGGSLGTQHIQKCAQLINMAAQWGIPMVWLLDSSGGRLGYTDLPTAGVDWYFALISRYSGLIPQITALMGPCIAGQAYAPVLCDFLFMSRGTSNLWLGGPRMTEAATSEKISADVGGADYHMKYSGTCDVVGENDEDNIKKVRKLLTYLPANYREMPPLMPTSDSPEREVADLVEIVPDQFDQSYDMYQVIKEIVDDGKYFDIKETYAPNLITCFCHFNGQAVGLVACNRSRPGSILEIDSCDKYYKFLQVLDAYNLPLVCLVDTSAYVPGQEQEEIGLLRHIGKILDLYATSTIPKVSVVLREAYADAGSMIMGGSRGMGVDVCFSWPVARFAVQASTFNLKNELDMGLENDAYEGYLNRSREKIDVFEVAESWTAHVVDEIIEPKDTRKKIIEGLEIAKNKKETFLPRAKTHGTSPV